MLRNKQGLLLIAVALVLGGCGMAPKNAEEFRQSTRDGIRAGLGGLGVSMEAFEVARPFSEVSSTLRRKANECLAVAVKWSATNSYGNTRSGVRTYKPTFGADSKRAELHVQLKREGGGEIDVGSPPDGFYQVVLDATPLAARRTRIDIYQGDKLIRSALRGWAQGDNLGCPDLTKR